MECPYAVDKEELLDAHGEEVLEPERELVLVPLHWGADEVDAAEQTWMRGEGAGHRVGEVARGRR